MISTSKILPNCCKDKQNRKCSVIDFYSCHKLNKKFNLNRLYWLLLLILMVCHTSTGVDVVLTPNICLRSGSLNLKGMLETWSLLGWALLSVLSGTVCVGGWLSVWAASSVCWRTQRKGLWNKWKMYSNTSSNNEYNFINSLKWCNIKLWSLLDHERICIFSVFLTLFKIYVELQLW